MPGLQTMTLYSHAGGPDPWKVAIILEELELPYEHRFSDMEEIKKEPYITINPNGRVPALEDPKQGITIWESGAVIDYLIDTYDVEGKLHNTSLPEKYVTRSWEHFQMSGQGPYFGQLVWFTNYHPEKIESAIERYAKEVRRVTGVIDASLKKQGTDYLIGNKITYADLMFVTWAVAVPLLAPEVDLYEFGMYNSWLERMTSRPAVAKVLAEKNAAMGP